MAWTIESTHDLPVSALTATDPANPADGCQLREILLHTSHRQIDFRHQPFTCHIWVLFEQFQNLFRTFPTLFFTASNASRNVVSMNTMNTRALPVLSASKMILRRAFGATGTSRPTGWADVPPFGATGTSHPTGWTDVPTFGATGTSHPAGRDDAPRHLARGVHSPVSVAHHLSGWSSLPVTGMESKMSMAASIAPIVPVSAVFPTIRLISARRDGLDLKRFRSAATVLAS